MTEIDDRIQCSTFTFTFNTNFDTNIRCATAVHLRDLRELHFKRHCEMFPKNKCQGEMSAANGKLNFPPFTFHAIHGQGKHYSPV